MKRIILLSFSMLLAAGALWAEDRIDVRPTAPYARFIIFQTLMIFWIGIAGLVTIIRMKLKEIERTQRMSVDKEEKDAPLLD